MMFEDFSEWGAALQDCGKPKGKAVLVTGATGFIGSHVAEALLSEGDCDVVVIVRDATGSRGTGRLRRQGAVLWEGAFHDAGLLKRVFSAHGIRQVVHCAALRGAGLGRGEDYVQINVLGTRTLAEASLKYRVERFIHCSSVGVYGTVPQELPATEDTTFNGDSAYHESKINAEREVREIASRGLNTLIVRPAITYGARDTGFPTTLVQLVRSRCLPVPSEDVKIHLLDVQCLASLISRAVLSVEDFPGVILAADEAPVTLQQLVDRIHQRYYGTSYPTLLRFPDPFFRLASAFFQLCGNHKWLTRIQLLSRSWYFDISESMRIPGYCPSKTLESFMRTMCP